MEKISIIGGSGFLGESLAHSCSSKNLDFAILDINKPKIYQDKYSKFNVCDKDNHDLIKGDIIINLAAEHRDDVKPLSKYSEVNIGGAHNICAIAEKKGINTIVFTSSVAVYGFAEKNTGENGEVRPFNEYGLTKAEAEKVYLDWYNKNPQKRKLIIIRPTAIFGKNNRGNIYNLFKQINSGFFLMIGGGKNIKSIAYVDNVAEFILHSLRLSPGNYLFNYVDKPDLSMNELVGFIRDTLGKSGKSYLKVPLKVAMISGYFFDFVNLFLKKPLPISSIRIKKFCADTQFDTSIEETGYKPKVSLLDAISKTLLFEFRKNDDI